MSYFEDIACKTTVVLTFGEDEEYKEKIVTALSFAGSLASPIVIENWLSQSFEDIMTYSGIIIISGDIQRVHEPEALGELLSVSIIKMGGRRPLPFSTQKILICKSNSSLIISAFSKFHGVDLEGNFEPNDDVFFWSIIRHNELRGRIRVMEKTPRYQ